MHHESIAPRTYLHGFIHVLIGAGAVSLAGAEPPPGAAAIWHFDDGAATVTDWSGNGNTGTFIDNATYTTDGVLPPTPGNVAALHLDGQSKVSVPSSPSLTMSGSFTITAWVRLNQQMRSTIISKDEPGNAYTNYNTWIYDNKLRNVVTFTTGPAPIVATSNGGAECQPGGCFMYTDELFVDAEHPLGTWRHIAVTYDDAGKTLTARIDCGIEASARFDTQGVPYTGPEAVQIGQRKAFGDPAMNGDIDALMIWPRVLTEAEIRQASGCTDPALCGACGYLAPLGAACGDGAECASGYCADGVCCDAACDAGECDACSVAAGAAVDGTCALLDGMACDDGNGCTGNEVCQGGACVPGGVADCVAMDECHEVGICEPSTGLCSNPVKPDGSPCSLGQCMAGVCVAGPDPDPGPGPDPGGCGCRTGGSPAHGAWLLLAVMVALRVRRRTRR